LACEVSIVNAPFPWSVSSRDDLEPAPRPSAVPRPRPHPRGASPAATRDAPWYRQIRERHLCADVLVASARGELLFSAAGQRSPLDPLPLHAASRALAGDRAVLFSIRDTGHGLPRGEIEAMFQSFFTTKPDGTSMGLSISRSIVESHGGRL
jgi:signal transduction histidine kinase